jgi:hypothetical protein
LAASGLEGRLAENGPGPGGPKAAAEPESAPCSIGRELDRRGGDLGRPVTIDFRALARHAAVFGTTGSGKTVLLKRLIDEAALSGIPSVVLDGAGDFSLLGQRWPSPPDSWLPGDAERAERFYQSAEAIVWTPGAAKGRPLSFPSIPDFGELRGDADEVESAISLSVSFLTALIGGKSGPLAEAVLRESLRHLASRGAKAGLDDLIGVLLRPPAIVLRSLASARKIAASLAQSLQAARVNHPELGREDSVEMEALLRTGSGKTAISVVYLGGLGAEDLKSRLACQLVMRLFSWIKKNPSKDGSLSGLLVIDEARDFAPSQKSAACKDAIIQFASQARKYGFGLVLASQGANNLDLNVVNNCGTFIIGRQSGKTVVGKANELLGEGADAASLKSRRFYVKTPANVEGVLPRLFESAASFSRHDPNSPSHDDILAISARHGSKARQGLSAGQGSRARQGLKRAKA